MMKLSLNKIWLCPFGELCFEIFSFTDNEDGAGCVHKKQSTSSVLQVFNRYPHALWRTHWWKCETQKIYKVGVTYINDYLRVGRLLSRPVGIQEYNHCKENKSAGATPLPTWPPAYPQPVP